MKLLLSILLCATLAGCACSTKVPVIDPVHIDREILTTCSNIPQFNPIEDEIGYKYIELVGMYGVCSNRQATSIKTIKELANIKDKE